MGLINVKRSDGKDLNGSDKKLIKTLLISIMVTPTLVILFFICYGINYAYQNSKETLSEHAYILETESESYRSSSKRVGKRYKYRYKAYFKKEDGNVISYSINKNQYLKLSELPRNTKGKLEYKNDTFFVDFNKEK